MKHKPPTAVFNGFFNDHVVEHMVHMTILYAHRDKGKHSFSTDTAEMCLFGNASAVWLFSTASPKNVLGKFR